MYCLIVLEVQDEGTGGLGFSQDLSPWLAGGYLLHPHMAFPPVCVHP